MKQRYIQAFASLSRSPLGSFPACALSADGHRGRYILAIAGIPNPDSARCECCVPLHMDRDEAFGLEDWICRALMMYPTTGFRSLYALRSGKIVGIKTDDGHTFLLLGGEGLSHGWDMQWHVLSSATRADINGLTDALAALRPPATREESRP